MVCCRGRNEVMHGILAWPRSMQCLYTLPSHAQNARLSQKTSLLAVSLSFVASYKLWYSRQYTIVFTMIQLTCSSRFHRLQQRLGTIQPASCQVSKWSSFAATRTIMCRIGLFWYRIVHLESIAVWFSWNGLPGAKASVFVSSYHHIAHHLNASCRAHQPGCHAKSFIEMDDCATCNFSSIFIVSYCSSLTLTVNWARRTSHVLPQHSFPKASGQKWDVPD